MVYGVSIFLSAFLLFMVQPLLGKYLTPWFGGGAGVWLTCLAFFQVILFFGYAYAYGMQRLPPQRQARIHSLCLLIMVACFCLMAWLWGSPILPDASIRPQPAANPSFQIAGFLSLIIGFPFLLLSATSSLYQAWWAAATPGESPFRFYALSNAGSLLALLAYPFVIEPVLPLSLQAWIWAAGFTLFAVLTLWISRRVTASSAPTPAPPAQDIPAPPSKSDFWLWTALSTCSCLSLMATTSQLTQDVAPVPFLWMLPLAIYLGTFILCFSGRLRVLTLDVATATLLLGCVLAITLLDRMNDDYLCLSIQITGFCLTQFCVCLYCHLALYETRPPARQLTAFYLAIALGGVIGGLGTTLLIPLIFVANWEYPLSFMAPLAVAFVVLHKRALFLSRWRRAHILILPLLLAGFALVMHNAAGKNIVERTRNFYGTLRVIRETDRGHAAPAHVLKHGVILHGRQFDNAPLRKEPSTYYGRITGIGLLFDQHPRHKDLSALTVGVIGLGVGTLAAYGQTGDTFRFYEINPEVIRLATQSRWFSYLRDCPAKVDIIQGDARLSLEAEVRTTDGSILPYDILVVDAFSGDSIPVHLLTREALALYLKRCKPGGVIAVHTSNRYLYLLPVLKRLREEFNLCWKVIANTTKFPLNTSSEWVLLSRTPDPLEAVHPDGHDTWTRNTTAVRSIKLWTDDTSNLLTIMK